MTDKYHVYLYHDTITQIQIRTFTSETTTEEYCRMLYFQLRAMGARGEIRVLKEISQDYQGMLLHENMQHAFVSLYDQFYKYVRT